jgi:hypothetical protein
MIPCDLWHASGKSFWTALPRRSRQPRHRLCVAPKIEAPSQVRLRPCERPPRRPGVGGRRSERRRAAPGHSPGQWHRLRGARRPCPASNLSLPICLWSRRSPPRSAAGGWSRSSRWFAATLVSCPSMRCGGDTNKRLGACGLRLTVTAREHARSSDAWVIQVLNVQRRAHNSGSLHVRMPATTTTGLVHQPVRAQSG